MAKGSMRNTKNYMALPYNPALKTRARELRKAGNRAEVLMWNQLKRGNFFGLDFDRQKIIGNYIVDFYCAETKTVVEVDGSSHDAKEEYDAQRDAFLAGLGLTVIHIRAEAVVADVAQVMAELKMHPVFAGIS
jgi:very-short-patch-repair endonuclease